MNEFLKRNTPPGADCWQAPKLLAGGIICSAVWSLIYFLFRFAYAIRALFIYYPDKKIRVIKEGAVMPIFSELVENSFWGFSITAICMLFFVIYYYSYYQQGSRSIYLMKRLPNRWELHRRAIVIPLLSSFSAVASAFVLKLIFLVIYLLATPEECLPTSNIYQLWGSLL